MTKKAKAEVRDEEWYQGQLESCNEQNITLAQRNVELSEQVDDLRRQLLELKRQLDAAKLDAAVHGDAFKLECERHAMTRAYVKSLEHTAEQWRQTANANERLHNVALDENQQLRHKLALAGVKS